MGEPDQNANKVQKASPGEEGAPTCRDGDPRDHKRPPRKGIEELLVSEEPYVYVYQRKQAEIQRPGKRLCWEFNRSSPDDPELRLSILRRLFRDEGLTVGIEPPFHCDYGFNIHFEGNAFINYNCTILDTSPVHIGRGVLIGPNVTIACVGHALVPEQRSQGVACSSPVRICEGAWVGAGATICPGVTIGANSVVGAGSVVTRDIPEGVVAAGVPCRVMRPITEDDRVEPTR